MILPVKIKKVSDPKEEARSNLENGQIKGRLPNASGDDLDMLTLSGIGTDFFLDLNTFIMHGGVGKAKPWKALLVL